jgi:hypothetical protein
MNGQKHWGIYYHVNELNPDCRDQRAKKTDISEAHFVHVDVDDAGAMERIKAFDPAPTATVFSGGGFNCLWRIEPTSSDQEAVEAVNKAIASALKADDCFNIDRVLRLPGTINYPNARKIAKGRTPAQAYVVEELTDPTREYTLSAFDHLPKPKPPHAKPVNRANAPWTPEAEKRVRSALDAIPIDKGDGIPYEQWLHIIMGLHWSGWPCARQIADDFSQRYPTNDPCAFDCKWEGFSTERDNARTKEHVAFSLRTPPK